MFRQNFFIKIFIPIFVRKKGLYINYDKEKVINIDSVEKYNKLFGLETLHPLVSVIDLTKATGFLNHVQMSYGVYALFLKENKSCDITYGHQTYDYDEGTIVCFAPGQVVSVDMNKPEVHPKVYGVLFHPDLIRGTSLGKTIHDYTFFSYAVSEALHLSEQERTVVLDCLAKIQMELEHALDKHSRSLIAMNIELLLNYCMRFYERQFITREKSNKDILVHFESLLNEYFESGTPEKEGLPSVKYFADKICLSPNYFGDLIKKETGMTAMEHIQNKLMDMAKEMILGTHKTMSQISYELGFQYPQHFGRLFKQLVGSTPNDYRAKNA